MVVKANHESRDEIEFLSKIGERSESFNLLDYTLSEQACNLPEHGQTVHIKTHS